MEMEKGEASNDNIPAFEECFLPMLKMSGRCGVFGARAAELVGNEEGWHRGDGGAYWKTFNENHLSSNACWSADRISLEVSILLPVSLADPSSAEALMDVIRRCYDPGTASNPTAIVQKDAFRFARMNAGKDILWLAYRSTPANLYLTVLGKPEAVRRWFRFAVENARGKLWSRDSYQ